LAPTTSVVGYVVSSLRDCARGSCQPLATIVEKRAPATKVGYDCGPAALCISIPALYEYRQIFVGHDFSRAEAFSNQ
jgi:hypothetical protein